MLTEEPEEQVEDVAETHGQMDAAAHASPAHIQDGGKEARISLRKVRMEQSRVLKNKPLLPHDGIVKVTQMRLLGGSKKSSPKTRMQYRLSYDRYSLIYHR